MLLPYCDNDVKEYVVFLASCSQLQTVRGEFEAFCVAKRENLNGSIFFGTFHIYAFLITIFFQIVDCVFAFENLLFWRGFNHLASISELI